MTGYDRFHPRTRIALVCASSPLARYPQFYTLVRWKSVIWGGIPNILTLQVWQGIVAILQLGLVPWNVRMNSLLKWITVLQKARARRILTNYLVPSTDANSAKNYTLPQKTACAETLKSKKLDFLWVFSLKLLREVSDVIYNKDSVVPCFKALFSFSCRFISQQHKERNCLRIIHGLRYQGILSTDGFF